MALLLPCLPTTNQFAMELGAAIKASADKDRSPLVSKSSRVRAGPGPTRLQRLASCRSPPQCRPFPSTGPARGCSQSQEDIAGGAFGSPQKQATPGEPLTFDDEILARRAPSLRRVLRGGKSPAGPGLTAASQPARRAQGLGGAGRGAQERCVLHVAGQVPLVGREAPAAVAGQAAAAGRAARGQRAVEPREGQRRRVVAGQVAVAGQGRGHPDPRRNPHHRRPHQKCARAPVR